MACRCSSSVRWWIRATLPTGSKTARLHLLLVASGDVVGRTFLDVASPRG
jgi:hypothetical protein